VNSLLRMIQKVNANIFEKRQNSFICRDGTLGYLVLCAILNCDLWPRDTWLCNTIITSCSFGWKYYSLIYYERKILFVDWKSTVYKLSEQGVKPLLWSKYSLWHVNTPSCSASPTTMLLKISLLVFYPLVTLKNMYHFVKVLMIFIIYSRFKWSSIINTRKLHL
jgi:hypothetical protein